jgi:hypothetical protein
MFDSFRSSVAAARESNQLFFAALIPAERIASTFGEASAILDSASVLARTIISKLGLSQTALKLCHGILGNGQAGTGGRQYCWNIDVFAVPVLFYVLFYVLVFWGQLLNHQTSF